MAESVFEDKATVPTDVELYIALGKTASLLKKIEKHLFELYGEVTREWKFYGKKAGWTLALTVKNRRVFHLIPRSGLFTVVFTFGKQAILACQKSELPTAVLLALEHAPEYAEGKSIRFDVIATDTITTIKHLVAIKIASYSNTSHKPPQGSCYRE